MNYHKYSSSVAAHVAWGSGGGGGGVGGVVSFSSFMSAIPARCVLFPKAKFSTFSQTMNLNLSRGRAALPDIRQNYLWGTWLSLAFDLSQGHRMWVDLDGTLSHLPHHS